MSLELSAESVEILLLQGQGALSGFDITNQFEDTAPDINRIAVKAKPREPEVHDHRQVTVKIWRIPVSVEINAMDLTAAQFDTVVAAVEAANTGMPAAAAVTAATTAFPNGCRTVDTEEGETDHTDNRRTRTKVFNFLVVA